MIDMKSFELHAGVKQYVPVVDVNRISVPLPQVFPPSRDQEKNMSAVLLLVERRKSRHSTSKRPVEDMLIEGISCSTLSFCRMLSTRLGTLQDAPHVGRRHDIDMIGRLAYRYRLKGYPHSRRVCRRHHNGCMISRIKNTGAVVHAEIRECLTPVYRLLKS